MSPKVTQNANRGDAAARPTRPRAGLLQSWIDQDDAEIVDVGLGRAAFDEVSDTPEKPRRVVVGQELGRNEIVCPGARQRVGQNDGAGGVRGTAGAAVGAVGIAGEPCYPGRAVERDAIARSASSRPPSDTVATNSPSAGL